MASLGSTCQSSCKGLAPAQSDLTTVISKASRAVNPALLLSEVSCAANPCPLLSEVKAALHQYGSISEFCHRKRAGIKGLVPCVIDHS